MASLCGDRPSVHSSLKAFMAELVRAPSPDSACEQDEPWSSHIRDAQHRLPPGKASANQDSDGDSGIDGSVERFSHRISSASSADTEPCCNLVGRRPESGGAGTALRSVDDSPPFSEQSMRRSCRQLMAALYASSTLDPRTAGRYRSFSLREQDAKRLSVPHAMPPSGAKLSVAPPFDGAVQAARSSLASDCQGPFLQTSALPASLPDHSAASSKHRAFRCLKGVPATAKDAGPPANLRKHPVRNASCSSHDTKEAVVANGTTSQSAVHSRQVMRASTDHVLACDAPAAEAHILAIGKCSVGARISEARPSCDPRAALTARTTPNDRELPAVSSHSTTSLSGPKTTLPPKALPLSLPGTPSKSRCGPENAPTMPVLFARPAAVAPPAPPQCSRHGVAEGTAVRKQGKSFQDLAEDASCTRPSFAMFASPKSTSLPTLVQQAADGRGGPGKGGVEYAVLARRYHHAVLSPIPRITSSPCVMDDALPPRQPMHKSDLALHSVGSAERGTLLGRVQELGRSARSALLRAFSTERIYRPQKSETAAAAARDGPTGRARTTLRRRRHIDAAAAPDNSSCSDPLWAGGHPTHVSAQLLQQNLDGSQVVELRRPPGRSFGFFLARGRVHAYHGVFVSRMPDARTQQVLQGLLDIGDEILEVNGTDVRDADIMEVNSLMTNQSTLLLTVLPYMCRKDI